MVGEELERILEGHLAQFDRHTDEALKRVSDLQATYSSNQTYAICIKSIGKVASNIIGSKGGSMYSDVAHLYRLKELLTSNQCNGFGYEREVKEFLGVVNGAIEAFWNWKDTKDKYSKNSASQPE